MKTVFADTLYWLAIVRPGDQWQAAARQARAAVGNVRLLTTDEVLVEFLGHLASGGPNLRRQAVEMVRTILSNPNVIVVPQTRESFLAGLTHYQNRLDKGYSLVDCISMKAMNDYSVTQVLTNDAHFTQEGFEVLISSPRAPQ